eukprot:gene13096-11729_t
MKDAQKYTDRHLEKYPGREEELIKQLVDKYGPEPDGADADVAKGKGGDEEEAKGAKEERNEGDDGRG